MTIHSDQQVLSRQTLPEAMMESYARCHPVPNLALLTKYRHDGKDALKFYTDPSYFFELWKQKMHVEFEKRMRKKVCGNINRSYYIFIDIFLYFNSVKNE